MDPQLLEQIKSLKEVKAVLKKAVVQEQDKVASLQAEAKQRNQEIQQLKADNNTLTFNNQRLTKRVEVLLEELQSEETKGKGTGWFSWGSGSKAAEEQASKELDAVKVDLEAKIDENEQLHIRMFDMQKEHQQTVETLERRLGELKKNLTSVKTALEDTVHTRDQTISGLESERDTVRLEREQIAKDLEEVRVSLETKSKEAAEQTQRLNEELRSIRAVYQAKVSFDDTAVGEYNRLNLPSFDRKARERFGDVAAEGAAIVDQIKADYQQYAEAATSSLNVRISGRTDENAALVELCKKTQNVLAESRDAFARLTDGLAAWVLSVRERASPHHDGDQMIQARVTLYRVFKGFVAAQIKVGRYQVNRFKLEIRFTSDYGHKKACSGLVDVYRRLCIEWERVLSVAKMGCGIGVQGRVNPDSVPRVLGCIHGAFQGLSAALSEVIGAMNALHRETMGLSDASAFLDVKLAENEREMLESISWRANRLVGVISSYKDLLMAPPSYPVRGVLNLECNVETPSMMALRFKARSLMKGTNITTGPKEDRSNRIRYADAMKAVLEVKSLREKEALQQRKVVDLEKAVSEHMDTASILKGQLESLQRALEAQRRSSKPQSNENGAVLQDESAPELTSVPAKSNGNGPSVQEGETVDDTSGDARLRAEVKRLRGQIGVLQAQLQEANRRRQAEVEQARLMGGARGGPGVADASRPAGNASGDNSDGRRVLGSGTGNKFGSMSYNMRVYDREGRSLQSLITPAELDRENMVKNTYETKLAQISAAADEADRQNILLRLEGDRARVSCENALREKKNVEEKLKEAQEQAERRQADLESTSTNYEGQLSLLTEHICQLGEANSNLEMQNARLKSHKVLCGKCQTWNKVSWLLSSEGRDGARCMGGDHPSSYNFG